MEREDESRRRDHPSDGDLLERLAARRIAWGKFMNAGQTCVAPDFVLVQRRVREPFLAAMKKCIVAGYGEDASRSADYGRIGSENDRPGCGRWRR
jgi:aldehyde dehydrogenase (NAD+)